MKLANLRNPIKTIDELVDLFKKIDDIDHPFLGPPHDDKPNIEKDFIIASFLKTLNRHPIAENAVYSHIQYLVTCFNEKDFKLTRSIYTFRKEASAELKELIHDYYQEYYFQIYNIY